MKLILTQEVAGLGGPGDVVEVKDGYGRNYLMPRGAAIRWTRGGEKQVSSIQRGREVRDVRDLGQAGEVKGRLESLSIKLPVRAGETGRLFGAVTVSDIVAAVAKARSASRSRRSAPTRSPSGCTPRSPPRCRSRSCPRPDGFFAVRRPGRPARGRRAVVRPAPVVPRGVSPSRTDRRPRMAGESARCEAQVPREVPTGLAKRRRRVRLPERGDMDPAVGTGG